MAKPTTLTSKLRARAGVAGKVRRKGVTIRFGGVTVKGERPTPNVVAANVATSSDALARVTKALVKPGVSLPPKKDVPRFSAVDDEPGVFIRRLNKVEQRGRLVDGRFEVID